MLEYRGEFPLQGDYAFGPRNARIVRNLNEFWARLHKILSVVFHVHATTTPIHTETEDEEDDSHYAQIFRFDAILRGENFNATLHITYNRSVDGPYALEASDSLSCELAAPGLVSYHDGVLLVHPFIERANNWHILEHGTPQEHTIFLAEFVQRVMSKMQHGLLHNEMVLADAHVRQLLSPDTQL
jgi:hypothetical protein